MPPSLIDADSMLIVDVGSVTTRAILFDVVDGRYRLLAVGSAPTTGGAPFHDIGEGIRQAFEHIKEITGRVLVGADERLIVPTAADGSGVDRFAATISAGPPLKVVAVGLLEDVSLESARRLAEATYAGVIETISLNNRRKTEVNIDTILRLRPDLIIAAGGTEGGASQSVLRLLEAVGLACYIMPEDQRPEMMFAGNQALQEEVQTSVGKVVNLHCAPNVRPALDVEQLDAGQTLMTDLVRKLRIRQMPGVKELDEWAGGGLMPSSAAFGRIIRYLSKVYPPLKGVLGVDIGAVATTVAAAFAGNLIVGTYPQFGLGNGISHLMDNTGLESVTRWLTMGISAETVRDYIYNKSIYPAAVPMTLEEQTIEEALARQGLFSAIRVISNGFPASAARSFPELLPWFEPILALGSVLTRAPSLARSLLILLDGLQPTGVTTLILDQNHITPGLGAAGAINPVLPVQVLDSTTLLHLGTVISPVGEARPGTPILRLKMKYESGHETTIDVKDGSLEVIPLPAGQTASVHLQPLHRFDVGMGGPGRGGGLKVVGGAMGVIVDARGRPFKPPENLERRQDAYKKWLWTLGG